MSHREDAWAGISSPIIPQSHSNSSHHIKFVHKGGEIYIAFGGMYISEDNVEDWTDYCFDIYPEMDNIWFYAYNVRAMIDDIEIAEGPCESKYHKV